MDLKKKYQMTTNPLLEELKNIICKPVKMIMHNYCLFVG